MAVAAMHQGVQQAGTVVGVVMAGIGFQHRIVRGRRMIGVAQGKLSFRGFVDSFKDAIGTTAQLFFIGIGAVIYTKFLALSGSASSRP